MVSLGLPFTGDEEVEAVRDLILSGNLSIGNQVESFEEAFSDFTNVNYAAAVSSGSVALELALQVSDLKNGDRVIVSAYNCAAVLYSLVRQNLQPIFCDIQPNSYNIDPECIENNLLEQNADGILITSLFGEPSEMNRIIEISNDHDLIVINDFAQSPGAKYEGNDIATYGDIGVCSFGATKNISTAEGGMVTSDEKRYVERVATLRSNTNGDFDTPLRSARMNDIEAAIGIQQLEKYERILSNKRKVAGTYLKQLSSEVELPETQKNRTNVYSGFPVQTENNSKLMQHLSKRDVESSVVYDKPLYEYKLAPQTDPSRFPQTESTSNETLLLPIHPNLTEEDVNEVVAGVNSYFD